MRAQQSRFRSHVDRRRRVALAVTTVALCAVGLPLGATPSLGQVASPNIEFLNPSAYAPADDLGIVVSDKLTTRPEAGDDTFRLSAWVQNPPPSPLVEFEVLRSGISLQTIDATVAVGADTWEADWSIPTLAPGEYTLRATLASGRLAVDSVDLPVTINVLAERAEIDYPNPRASGDFPGGQLGTFQPLARSADGGRPGPLGNIEAKTSGASSGTGTSRVRAFYTTSSPGTVPAWEPCGTENAPGDAFLSGAANNGIRCELSSSFEQQLVTAVAVVANTSQGDEYDSRLNAAGDAARVLAPYAQTVGDLEIVEGAVATVEEGLSGGYACHSVSTQLDDQFGREIVGANIDVEAFGPSDGLRFDTGLLPVADVQAPDQGSHALETGYDCFGDDDSATPADQGEHQVVGGPDLKHVESAPSGTDDTGTWGFSVRIPGEDVSDSRFTTYFAIWVDETDPGGATNDDGFNSSELCAAGAVGWGAFPANPDTDGALLPCQPPPLCPPAPSATDPTGAEPAECLPEEPVEEVEHRLTIRVRYEPRGAGRFGGRLISADVACEPARAVVLKLRDGGRFVRQATTRTDAEGRWRIEVPFVSRGLWKAVARASTCPKVTSKAVRLGG